MYVVNVSISRSLFSCGSDWLNQAAWSHWFPPVVQEKHLMLVGVETGANDGKSEWKKDVITHSSKFL